jgi:hypothetical protein
MRASSCLNSRMNIAASRIDEVRYDRCRARTGREETDLAEDVARAKRPDDVAVSAHLGAAGLDHEPG